jgi:SAM-dependent methyltransferase
MEVFFMSPLDEIKNSWLPKPVDKEATLKLWEGQAKQNCYTKIPDFKTNKFLQLLVDEYMLSSHLDVLDVGCGAGAYSIALAPYVHSITGIDLSEGMIQNGKELSKNIENLTLEVGDWHTLSLKEKGWEKKFDLVFAHMSPAIGDIFSLEKLLHASKKYCVVTKPTRRTDSVLDVVKEMVGLKETRTDLDSDIRKIFNYTWLIGLQPKLMYEPQEWLAVRTIDEAFTHYTSRIGQFMELSQTQNDEIYHYLTNISKDGKVEEVIKSLTVTIYWEV